MNYVEFIVNFLSIVSSILTIFSKYNSWISVSKDKNCLLAYDLSGAYIYIIGCTLQLFYSSSLDLYAYIVYNSAAITVTALCAGTIVGYMSYGQAPVITSETRSDRQIAYVMGTDGLELHRSSTYSEREILQNNVHSNRDSDSTHYETFVCETYIEEPEIFEEHPSVMEEKYDHKINPYVYNRRDSFKSTSTGSYDQKHNRESYGSSISEISVNTINDTSTTTSNIYRDSASSSNVNSSTKDNTEIDIFDSCLLNRSSEEIRRITDSNKTRDKKGIYPMTKEQIRKNIRSDLISIHTKIESNKTQEVEVYRENQNEDVNKVSLSNENEMSSNDVALFENKKVSHNSLSTDITSIAHEQRSFERDYKNLSRIRTSGVIVKFNNKEQL